MKQIFPIIMSLMSLSLSGAGLYDYHYDAELDYDAGLRWKGYRFSGYKLEGAEPAFKVRFHHSLHKYFKGYEVDEFEDLLPRIRGTLMKVSKIGWNTFQPDFCNPDLVDFVALGVLAKQAERPALATHSLAMTDFFFYSDRCPNQPFFRDLADYSDEVFGFTKAVIDQVRARYPRLYFGNLAYLFCERYPGDDLVSPYVIPFNTFDHSQWYDADYKKECIDNMRRWGASPAHYMGVYNYHYGQQFVVPRIYQKDLYESIRTYRGFGFDYYYAELSSHAAFDYPKNWLMLQLLRGAEGDFDSLMGHFYGQTYGVAADAVQAFFEDAEAIWARQPGPARWIKYFLDLNHCLLYSETDMRCLRGDLDRASAQLQAAEENPARSFEQRVQDWKASAHLSRLSELFRLTEVYWAWVQAERVLAISEQGESVDRLISRLERYLTCRKEALTLLTGFRSGRVDDRLGAAAVERLGLYEDVEAMIPNADFISEASLWDKISYGLSDLGRQFGRYFSVLGHRAFVEAEYDFGFSKISPNRLRRSLSYLNGMSLAPELLMERIRFLKAEGRDADLKRLAGVLEYWLKTGQYADLEESFELLLDVIENRAHLSQELIYNHDFRESPEEVPLPYLDRFGRGLKLHVVESDGASVTSKAEGSGRVYRFEGIYRSTFSAAFYADPDRYYYAELDVKARLGSPATAVKAHFRWMDEDWNILSSGASVRIPYGDTLQDRMLTVLDEAPAGAVYGQIVLQIDYMESGDELWVRDCSVREIAEGDSGG